MKRSQRPASESPRPADVTTAGDQEGAQELPSLDEHGLASDEVARRAYERYEARGRQDGRDMDDWLEAERELRESTSPRQTGDGSTARIKQ